jgi:hypothetical protein
MAGGNASQRANILGIRVPAQLRRPELDCALTDFDPGRVRREQRKIDASAIPGCAEPWGSPSLIWFLSTLTIFPFPLLTPFAPP